MAKKISIIIPTFNRAHALREYLPSFRRQVLRNYDQVELIVCDNASTDDTQDALSEINGVEPFFSVVRYSEHEPEIGRSIFRSAENAQGDFIQFFGDDDLPAPNMVDYILDVAERHPDVGCVHLNRLQTITNSAAPLLPFKNLFVYESTYPDGEVIYDNTSDFINAIMTKTGFLGSFLLLREAWNAGVRFYDRECFGFEFLPVIFMGIKDRKCICSWFPMMIQRQLEPARYAHLWPLYIYVGLPRVLQRVQEGGVLRDWKAAYNKFYWQKDNSFFSQMVFYCTKHKEIYQPYFLEIRRNQESYLRKMVVSVVRFPMPIVRFVRIFYYFLLTGYSVLLHLKAIVWTLGRFIIRSVPSSLFK